MGRGLGAAQTRFSNADFGTVGSSSHSSHGLGVLGDTATYCPE